MHGHRKCVHITEWEVSFLVQFNPHCWVERHGVVIVIAQLAKGSADPRAALAAPQPTSEHLAPRQLETRTNAHRRTNREGERRRRKRGAEG